MTSDTIEGSSTAIARKKPSAPMRWLERHGYVPSGPKLDWGCGKGTDAEFYMMTGYDPAYSPELPPEDTEWVAIYCNYVLNVVKEESRNEILQELWRRSKGCPVYVTVRRDLPKGGQPGRGCYQHYVELDLPILHENSRWCTYLMSSRKPDSLEEDNG